MAVPDEVGKGIQSNFVHGRSMMRERGQGAILRKLREARESRSLSPVSGPEGTRCGTRLRLMSQL
jgi:hypothetical protein